MNFRALMMTLVGLIIAAGSVWATVGERAATSDTSAAGPRVMQLISARHDIRFGEEITIDMLAVQEWPGTDIPENTFTDVSQLIAADGGKPRRAKETIRKGELLLADDISEFGETVTMVQALGSNSRAVAIRVDAVTAVGGFVTPGDRVDILMTQGSGASLRAATILQDIRVLGVDQNTQRSAGNNGAARTITVEVSPRDGQLLTLAQKAGALSLTLRTEQDVADADLGQISLDDLMRNAEPVVVPSAAPAPVEVKRTVTVRRGTAIELVEVE